MHYDTHGTLALSGIKHYDSLGEMPSGMNDKDKDRLRKSYYYLYTLATMEPVFRKQAGISTAVGVAGVVSSIVTGGLGLIATGVAGAAGLAMAAGTENCVVETTAFWTKSKRARDEFIARAMVGGDVKQMLQKAARRMDSVVAQAKSRQARHAARARAYFLDFIAVGSQKNLKSQLNEAQQAAFGAAYLSALGNKKKVADCMVAGANAATAIANQQARREHVRGTVAAAKVKAKAKRDAVVAAAKAKARAEIELKAVQAKGTVPGGSAPAQIRQAQAQLQTASAALQQAEAASVSADREVSVAVAQQEQALAPPPEQAASVAEQSSSEEDKAVEAANPQAAAAENAAVAAGASPDAAVAAGDAVAAGAAPAAAAAAAVAQTAAGADGEKGGFPVVPVLAVAGIAAFLLMRKK